MLYTKAKMASHWTVVMEWGRHFLISQKTAHPLYKKREREKKREKKKKRKRERERKRKKGREREKEKEIDR